MSTDEEVAVPILNKGSAWREVGIALLFRPEESKGRQNGRKDEYFK
jgi:hypothetical protein